MVSKRGTSTSTHQIIHKKHCPRDSLLTSLGFQSEMKQSKNGTLAEL